VRLEVITHNDTIPGNLTRNIESTIDEKDYNTIQDDYPSTGQF
jgi:hypothetical protein